MIRLLAVVQKRPGLSPGQRFRLEQWAPNLESLHGISLDFLPFESPSLTEIIYQSGHLLSKSALIVRDTIRRREVLSRAFAYDAVVIYREASLLGPAIYERLLARAGVPFIYDFDDAVWMRPPASANGFFSRLTFRSKTSTICRLASAVVTGNQYLAEYASRYSNDVHVIPSTIDLGKYPVQPELPTDQPFTITWIGSQSSIPYLEEVREPLALFGRRRETVLRIICSKPPARPFEGVRNEFVRWNAEDEAQHIGRSHVGIMPLPDDDFTRGKCGLKALQYMAVGRPAVASPVGVNNEIITHNQNGYLASTSADWLDAWEQLAESPQRRQQVGQAGRRTVEAAFSSTAGAAGFAKVIESVLSRSGAGTPVALTKAGTRV